MTETLLWIPTPAELEGWRLPRWTPVMGQPDPDDPARFTMALPIDAVRGVLHVLDAPPDPAFAAEPLGAAGHAPGTFADFLELASDWLVSEAQTARESGAEEAAIDRFGLAVQAYRQLTRVRPRDAALLANLGAACYDGAVLLVERAPRVAHALAEQAVEHLNTALRLDRGVVAAYFTLSACYRLLGAEHDARVTLSTVVKIAPGSDAAARARHILEAWDAQD